MKKVFCLLLFLVFVPSSSSALMAGNNLPPPLTEIEYKLLHPKERYGACWHFCKDDIVHSSRIITNLMSQVDWQQYVMERQKRYIDLQQEEIKKQQFIINRLEIRLQLHKEKLIPNIPEVGSDSKSEEE